MPNLQGISVVIPNYNGRDLLGLILPPLFIALNNTAHDYEVIVSDDCSADDSLIILQKNYPSVLTTQNESNQGFSPTINKGIFVAKYDYILLLNSDVKLEPDYFAPLFRYFERTDTFGVMGRIIGWDKDDIQDAAKYPSFHGVKIKTSQNYYAAQPTKDDWLYSMYLSGANAFIDRNKLLQLGGFDELFAPFYVEDFELSLRAWRLGWRCYYEHFSICRHQVSVSIKSKSSKKFVNTIYYRNKLFLHALHLSGARLLIWYFQLIPEMLIRLFTFRLYYFTSLKMFFLARDKVKLSKENFLNLAQNNTLRSTEDIVNIIQNSLEHRNIIKF